MKLRTLLAFVICLVLAVPAAAQIAPDKVMSTFTVADGLQLEMFAHEPMVINPTSIDVDEKGRVWVCEGVNYRRLPFGRPTLRKEGDRIVVLIDKDADGKADDSVVFYQGKEIIAPLGIAVAPYPSPDRKGGVSYKVFVCQSPDILLFEDKDGDLKADGPPKKFLSGFKGIDHDHGVHGINIGPDGKLYFTVGDAGVDGLQSSDGKGPKFKSNSTDCRAGTVWRCDMDGKNLELIAHNFRNNYECCVNSFGEIWLSDNDDDGNQQTRICHVMPGGNYGYHPRGPGQSHWHEEQPGIVHKAFRAGFGSPTGICFYEGTLLPKKYHGQLLHTDAGPRELRAFHIKPKGAGYEAEKENLVTSTDNWFRLSDVCVAPDGSVILADWYDPGVGGHGMGDWTRGRIYRITPKGHKGYKVPEVTLSVKDDAIIKTLWSPNLAARSIAIQELQKHKPNIDVIGLAHAQGENNIMGASDPKNWLVMRVLYCSFPAFHKAALELMLEKKDKRPERHNLNEFSGLGHRFDKLLLKGFGHLHPDLASMPAAQLAEYESLVKSLSPSLSSEVLVALRNTAPDVASRLILPLAKNYDGQDRFYRAALNIACGTDPARRDAILADFEKHFPEWNDKVADLVWELRPKSMLPKMEKLLADAKLTAQQKSHIIDILAANDEPAAGKTMLNLILGDYPPMVKERAVVNLQLFLPTKWSGLRNSDELKKVIDLLLADTQTMRVGLQLIAAANLVDRVDAVDAIADNSSNAGENRIEAVRTLGKLKSPKAVDVLIARSKKDITRQAMEDLSALAAHITVQAKDESSRKALARLQEIVLEGKGVAWSRVAIEALAGTRAGSAWLLDLHAKKELPEPLVEHAGRLLRNSPFQGERNRALLLFPAPGKLDPKKLPPISELAKRSGNVEKGKQLMAASLKGETQCLKCHTVRGVGGNIGPDLSMIGKKASLENLFESILQPSKAIADEYLQWQIENAAGQKVLGLLIEDNATGVTIRDANGKDTKIAKADIEKRTKNLVSIMPEDVVKGFSEDDLVDVVAYLFTLKTPSLTPETWHIVGPFENDASDKGLDTTYPPEKGVELSAMYKGKNGDVKWKTVRHNGTGYVDLMAHYGSENTQIASYVYQRIESPADQEATILLGNDDGAKLWVNGELVLTNREHVAAAPERLKQTVKLKKGVNTVLMKIVNGNGPHGFYLSIASEQELKVAPMK